MRIGNRLLTARQDRQLNQAEMADLLNIAPATYSRLERNDTSIDIDQVVAFASKLEIPIQEFLPETITISNNNQSGHSSHIALVVGDINHYNYYSDKEIAQSLEAKDQENQGQKEKIQSLESKIKELEQSIALLKSTK